jgi:hypothetical protein
MIPTFVDPEEYHRYADVTEISVSPAGLTPAIQNLATDFSNIVFSPIKFEEVG